MGAASRSKSLGAVNVNAECQIARLKREIIEVREQNVRLIYECQQYSREAEKLREDLKLLIKEKDLLPRRLRQVI